MNCVRSKGERREAWTATLWPEDKSVPLAVWGAQQVWWHKWSLLKVHTACGIADCKLRVRRVCEIIDYDCLLMNSESLVSLILRHLIGHVSEPVSLYFHPHSQLSWNPLWCYPSICCLLVQRGTLHRGSTTFLWNKVCGVQEGWINFHDRSLKHYLCILN